MHHYILVIIVLVGEVGSMVASHHQHTVNQGMSGHHNKTGSTVVTYLEISLRVLPENIGVSTMQAPSLALSADKCQNTRQATLILGNYSVIPALDKSGQQGLCICRIPGMTTGEKRHRKEIRRTKREEKRSRKKIQENKGINLEKEITPSVNNLVTDEREKGSYNKQFPVRVLAILLDQTSTVKSYTEEGVIKLFEATGLTLHLVGFNMRRIRGIKFTTASNIYGGSCRGSDGVSHFQSEELPVNTTGQEEGYARVVIPRGLEYHSSDQRYYLCVRDSDSEEYTHQGSQRQLQIIMNRPFLPVWVMVVLLVILLCLSGLFSGLNLGLMSLDQTELKIVMSTGTDKEKSYAKAIMPIRGMGNFLLCSILLGNVLVNNTLTITLDMLTGGGGTLAVIGATIGIVVFGEIIPQAICSRHGLAVGANTIWLTKFFMLLTSPLSFPISKILDLLLGSEIGTVYNRERLMELLRVTDQYNDLEKDEINIVTGALRLKQKSVKEVMTHLDDCYMLPIESSLNFETVSEIKEQGYSRIPVYRGERTNIVYILFAKDLLFIDPDDEKPIEEVCKFYKNEVNFVYYDASLTEMLDEFKSGEKGHMAVVQKVNTEGDGDPFHETIGLVTLEDIIEEIIQQEINDETDVIIDNKTKKKRKRDIYKKDADFKMFLGTKTHHRVIISPQMSLAILQFLTTSVQAFFPENCSQRILQRLLSMDVYRQLKVAPLRTSNNNKNIMDANITEDDNIIMMKGRPCDFFVLVLEGRVEVIIGKEGHTFHEGPFSYYGEQMLEQALLTPSSTMVSTASQATNTNNSTHQMRPPLKRTSTQLQLIKEGSMIGSVSSDSNLAPTTSSKSQWIPDYTLKAVSDLLYLKVRKNTYMVAVKASKMENRSSSSGHVWRDEDIDEVLIKITENDDDFTKFGIKSPDINCNLGFTQSKAVTPSSSRRESVLRRDSVWSTFSIIKSKLGGRSNSSIENVPEDKFWEVFNKNKVSARNSKDFIEQARALNAVPTRQSSLMSDPSIGNRSLSIKNLKEGVKRTISDASDATELPELDGGLTNPVRSICESNTNISSSPSDRTSLLQPE